MTGVRPRSATCEAIRTRTPSTIRTIRAAPPMAAPMAISAIPASTSPTPSTRTRTPGTDHAPLSVIGLAPGPSPRSSDSCVVITLTSGWPGLISVSERIRARRPAAARPALHHAADGDLAHLGQPLRGGPGSDPYADPGQGEPVGGSKAATSTGLASAPVPSRVPRTLTSRYPPKPWAATRTGVPALLSIGYGRVAEKTLLSARAPPSPARSTAVPGRPYSGCLLSAARPKQTADSSGTAIMARAMSWPEK